MSLSTSVEQIEKGDRLEVWFANAPVLIVVRDITEGASYVPHGQTVTLVC